MQLLGKKVGWMDIAWSSMIIRTLFWRPRLWQSAPSAVSHLPFNCVVVPQLTLAISQRRLSLSPASTGGLALPSLRVDNEETLRNKGVPGLYQPHGFSAAWYDYQGWCVRQLNERIARTTNKTIALLSRR